MIERILWMVGLSFVMTLVVAVGLIFTQRTVEMAGQGGLDFRNTLAAVGADARPTQSVAMRDGYALQMRRYETQATDAPLLVLVHGSGWHGLQFDALAQQLSATAEVIVPDLRGHGAAPGQRGDLKYIGQFEDDLADLIAARAKVDQKVVLAGHSSGGGLVVRFAGGPRREMINAAVVMAPFLKHDAPTTRPNSGGWARVMVRRMIGLSILNTFGIKALNHKTVVQFDMPKAVLEGPLGATATTSYSYRLNTSFAPRSDYLADVAALPPFLLIAGAQDEAFVASEYEPLMSQETDKGSYLIVEGVNHLDIVNAPETAAAIREFLQ
jgi:pimeloyl-ACP methyl ester carboxylesterase